MLKNIRKNVTEWTAKPKYVIDSEYNDKTTEYIVDYLLKDVKENTDISGTLTADANIKSKVEELLGIKILSSDKEFAQILTAVNAVTDPNEQGLLAAFLK